MKSKQEEENTRESEEPFNREPLHHSLEESEAYNDGENNPQDGTGTLPHTLNTGPRCCEEDDSLSSFTKNREQGEGEEPCHGGT